MRRCCPSVSAMSLAFVLAACGGGDDAAAAGGGATARGGAEGKALGIAFGLPRVVAAAAYQSRSTVAEAVYFACAQTSSLQTTGQITTTGTVAITQYGAQYLPTPADKLVVQRNGETEEFESISANGNQAADTAITWLQSPHRLAYVYRVPGKGEARIDEQFDGSRFTSTLKGFSQLGGERYEIDLTASGGTQGTSDLDGTEAQSAYDVVGTVRGGGIEVDVKERHFSNYASAVSIRMLYSQRGWASQFRATIASTVKSGGSSYRFDSVQVETGAKEKGGQQTSDVVSTSGAILRDDRPWAQVTLQNGVAVAVAGGTVFPLALPAN